MQITAKELAYLIEGQIEGNPDVKISAPSKIEEGIPGTVSFLANPKYEPYIYTSKASVILVERDFEASKPISATLIRVENVYEKVALLLNKFGDLQEEKASGGIHSSAVVSDGAEVDSSVRVSANVVIEDGVRVGANTILYPQVYLGKNVQVGDNCIVYPGVKIYKDCVIGSSCILHSNSVIGSDGFGFAPQQDGSYKKIAQLGNVVLADHVEIGANAVIDRATMGSTVVEEGVKLDNLVQVAHNVRIGSHTVIAAQTGIAGSTKIGSRVMMGGQVGVAGHIEVADQVKVQAQSGVNSSVKEKGSTLFGYPAIGYRDYLRSFAIFKKLPEILSRLSKLEKENTSNNK